MRTFMCEAISVVRATAISIVLTSILGAIVFAADPATPPRGQPGDKAKPPASATQPVASRVEQPSKTQPSSARSRSGFVDEKYDNGKLKSHYSVDARGTKAGPYTLYSEDGKRIERGTFRNGVLDGSRQTFYLNGNVKLLENYRSGLLNGAVAENDESGAPVRIAAFDAGRPTSDRTQVNGILVYPRSTAMIQAELDQIRKTAVETLPTTTTIPPHEGGNDSQPDREAAVRRLMEYRYLCYVPYENMKLDPAYCAHDEAAAGILSVIGKLDHTPANPGWPEDQYKFAYVGTSSSNLHGDGRGGPLCAGSVDAYMNDSDASNIDRVGHRRWCLNPPMGKVGFASFKGFAAMWSMDASRKQVPSYEFVAYPAPGHFPSSYFGSDTAWSVSLNESMYRKPVQSALTVTITPATAQLDKNKLVPAGKPLDLKYNAVNLGGFGIPWCLIFRPVDLKTEAGSGYLVEITGLQSINGKPADIRYFVEFFNARQSDSK